MCSRAVRAFTSRGRICGRFINTIARTTRVRTSRNIRYGWGCLHFKLTTQDLESRINDCTGIKLSAAQRSEQQRQNLANILNVTRTPERTLLINMDRATFLFQDIVHRRLAGRNPFSNIGVKYTGSHGR